MLPRILTGGLGVALWLVAGAPLQAQATLAETRAPLTPASRQRRACRWWCYTAAMTVCSWCEKLRLEHLALLSRDPEAKALVRELHMDRATPLTDFAERRTTSADFAKQMQTRFAPTVMFHGPDGVQLAESIVGYRLADFYGAYLDQAIEEARNRPKARQ